MFLIGLIDDLWSLRPVTKLVFEIAVASFLVFFGYRLGWVTSLTLDTILTLFWIVGFTNAFNLLDNMDGLCAGLSVVAGAGVLAGACVERSDRPRRRFTWRFSSERPAGSCSTTFILHRSSWGIAGACSSA